MENINCNNILSKFYVLLLETLDPNEVSLQLLTAGVLTSDDKEKIEEKPSQKEKNEELLMVIATKGPRAYEELVKALEKDQCFLACQLLKEGTYSTGQHEMASVVICKSVFSADNQFKFGNIMHKSVQRFLKFPIKCPFFDLKKLTA